MDVEPMCSIVRYGAGGEDVVKRLWRWEWIVSNWVGQSGE